MSSLPEGVIFKARAIFDEIRRNHKKITPVRIETNFSTQSGRNSHYLTSDIYAGECEIYYGNAPLKFGQFRGCIVLLNYKR